MIAEILFSSLIAAGANAAELIETTAAPQDETMVFGEAEQPNGTFNAALVEQPQNAPNPLGAPIYDSSPTPAPFSQSTTIPVPFTQTVGNIVEETSRQNPAISQMSPQTMSKEIQNKLYQSGNRIYDVQSYPADDIGYINQNNQANAITNYPAY